MYNWHIICFWDINKNWDSKTNIISNCIDIRYIYFLCDFQLFASVCSVLIGKSLKNRIVIFNAWRSIKTNFKRQSFIHLWSIHLSKYDISCFAWFEIPFDTKENNYGFQTETSFCYKACYISFLLILIAKCSVIRFICT